MGDEEELDKIQEEMAGVLTDIKTLVEGQEDGKKGSDPFFIGADEGLWKGDGILRRKGVSVADLADAVDGVLDSMRRARSLRSQAEAKALTKLRYRRGVISEGLEFRV